MGVRSGGPAGTPRARLAGSFGLRSSAEASRSGPPVRRSTDRFEGLPGSASRLNHSIQLVAV